MELNAPPPESTPLWELIQFTRALAVIRGDTDHPVMDHLDDIEENLHVLEHLYQTSVDFPCA